MIRETLTIDAMLVEERVRGSLSERSVSDKDGNDVRSTRNDGDASLLENVLDGSGVEHLKPSVAKELLLVRDRRLSARDDGRRKRGREDEAGRVRSDEIDEVGRTGNVSSDSTVRFAERAGDDVDTVHDRTGNRVGRVASGKVSGVVEVLSNTSASRTVHANSVNLKSHE